MIKREQFLSLLNRDSKQIVPWIMGFSDEKVALRLLGEECLPSDVLPEEEFTYGASPADDWEVKANYAEQAGIPAVPVGKRASLAFGHGGPGEFSEKTVSSSQQKRITMYETGVMKEVRYDPHFYHHYNYPLKNLEDYKKIQLPNPDDPARYEKLADEVAYHKSKDRMTFTNLNGFFSGVHYFIYPYQDLLADLVLRPDQVKAIIDLLGEFNLRTAKHILEAGVDIICFCDDLGSGSNLLMSPELYRKFFKKWHGELAGLCHKYGAFLHMHSHGNINQIMDDLYEIGIDILNPLDPSEGMDLNNLALKYGDKIFFAGGVNKFYFTWTKKEQQDYLSTLFSTVQPGFFLMDSGGIPEDIKYQEWNDFKALIQYYKEKYKR